MLHQGAKVVGEPGMAAADLSDALLPQLELKLAKLPFSQKRAGIPPQEAASPSSPVVSSARTRSPSSPGSVP